MHQLPGVRGQLELVIGRHAILAQSVAETFHRIPVQAQARAHHQRAIANAPAILQYHRLLLRLEAGNRGANPVCAMGDAAHHRTLSARPVKNAGADQRPAGLVIVLLTRLYHRNTQVWLTLQEAGSDRTTGCAATHYQHVVTLGG